MNEHEDDIPDAAGASADFAESGAEQEVEQGSEQTQTLNTGLNDVLDLLVAEVDRLKVELEFYRLSQLPDKDLLIRECVQNIDNRQDRVEEIKALILASGDSVH